MKSITETIQVFFKPEVKPAQNLQPTSPNLSTTKRNFTPDELYAFRTESKRCLVGLFGHVYDIRRYLVDHPGGERIIRGLQGHDITDIITENPNHKDLDEQQVIALLNKYHCEEIGTIGVKPR